MRVTAKYAVENGWIKEDALKSKTGKNKIKPPSALVCPIDGTTPHQILWRAVVKTWGVRAKYEYPNAVPGKKYRIDIAFPDIKLAIEFDGWEFHGKYKEGFQKDRDRQNHLTKNGWRILRFYYQQVNKDLIDVLLDIKETINLIDSN